MRRPSRSRALELDAALVPDADEQGVVAGLDAAQVEGGGVLVASVESAAVEPDLGLRDREVGPNEERGAATQRPVWQLHTPGRRGRVGERLVGEVSREQRIQIRLAVAAVAPVSRLHVVRGGMA